MESDAGRTRESGSSQSELATPVGQPHAAPLVGRQTDRSLGDRSRAGGIGRRIRFDQPRRIAVLQRQPRRFPQAGAALSPSRTCTTGRVGAPRRAGRRPLPTIAMLRCLDPLSAPGPELYCPGEFPTRPRLLSVALVLRVASKPSGIGHRASGNRLWYVRWSTNLTSWWRRTPVSRASRPPSAPASLWQSFSPAD